MDLRFDINCVPTPCYVIDEKILVKNLEILRGVIDKTGCKILLAQKAFSMFYFYPTIARYLSGTSASGLYEAKLGRQEMGLQTHIFSPAYTQDEFDEVLEICDHIVFNSFSQWEKFYDKAIKSGKKFGIRINPEFSTQDHAIYDPCSKGSRLGVTLDNFKADKLYGISGLHFHTLCEQNSHDLKRTMDVVEKKFGDYLYEMEWINIGGGHHITKEGYDLDVLISCILHIKEKYNLEVFVEPGEAIALNAGFLVSKVLDIVRNDIDTAILDASAACHMPDVLEMPYVPQIIGASGWGQRKYNYRLAGPTCLAGDIIGDYSFDRPLNLYDRIVFCDMAIYTMVKNNTFNGIKLPSIAVCDINGNIKVIKNFNFSDFKSRLS
ncbi:MAG: carboxynorspermidine decarboxylase [Oscillospiraceae bacterium]|jgi:carboxynorspermidine decarboxylase|nr:carboxynorspermidine decarboxylase [Oscillospiraceae bacterium]